MLLFTNIFNDTQWVEMSFLWKEVCIFWMVSVSCGVLQMLLLPREPFWYSKGPAKRTKKLILQNIILFWKTDGTLYQVWSFFVWNLNKEFGRYCEDFWVNHLHHKKHVSHLNIKWHVKMDQSAMFAKTLKI